MALTRLCWMKVNRYDILIWVMTYTSSYSFDVQATIDPAIAKFLCIFFFSHFEICLLCTYFLFIYFFYRKNAKNSSMAFICFHSFSTYQLSSLTYFYGLNWKYCYIFMWMEHIALPILFFKNSFYIFFIIDNVVYSSAPQQK